MENKTFRCINNVLLKFSYIFALFIQQCKRTKEIICGANKVCACECCSACVRSTKEFNKVGNTAHGLHTLRSFTRYHFGKLCFLFVLQFYTIALAVAALCFCPLFILVLQIVLMQLLYRAIKSYLLIPFVPSYSVR